MLKVKTRVWEYKPQANIRFDYWRATHL